MIRISSYSRNIYFSPSIITIIEIYFAFWDTHMEQKFYADVDRKGTEPFC